MIAAQEVAMRRLGCVLAVLAVLASASCGGGKVVVGVVLPITGEASAYGTSINSGTKLGFDEAIKSRNAPPGLEVIYRDTGSDSKRAAAEAESLLKQGALIVIGGATSPEAKSMIPVAERHGKVLISPSATEPGLAASSNLFFRIYPSDEIEGVVAAQFLGVGKGAKSLLVLKEEISYTRGLLPIFREEYLKHGGKIVAELTIGEGNWDTLLGDALTKEKPDAVYVAGYGDAILQAIRDLRDKTYEGTVCTTSAIGTADLVWQGGTLVEGVYFPMVKLDMALQREPLKSFVARYKAANNNLVPDVYAAHGYDAALMTLAAIADPRPETTSDLLQRLMSLGDQMGVTGPMAVDGVGNTTHQPRIHCIRSAKVEDCDPRPL